ncbi:NepR family anti-sigma factor [Sphingomonas sp. PAMC 26617]|uniref:NepR family anti-sigma factor n=1 Tax=Sphingomonas sp. PAMC 26617 TaxID=1112216 RepID=UPI0002F26F7D|nr:NepR family anti-sigma factor [Sphingomonas sp. PAMC 26617]
MALRSGDDSSKKPEMAITPKSGRPGAAASVQNKDRDMGAALRTVYQRTVEEAIPSEMLDLLGKLD